MSKEVKTERIFTGSVFEKNYGYCRLVKVGNFAFVAGTVGLGATAEEQTKAAFKTIEDALIKAGGSLKDVVRTRIFLTNIEKDFDSVGRMHGAVFGKFPPAMALIGIKALVDPKYTVEVEADAIIGSGSKL